MELDSVIEGVQVSSGAVLCFKYSISRLSTWPRISVSVTFFSL